jgi:hypothetical protein
MGLGPGIAKVRHIPFVQVRRRELVAVTEHLIEEWLEHADVMSEGADRGAWYFGTTSIVLRSAGREPCVLVGVDVDAAILGCPHLRLRALRVAHREALARSGCDLGTIRAELSIRRDPRGVVIHIDVEAPHDARRALALHP